ncbi:MAG TPA: hypothetical protein VHO25_18790 [Polyangiaceae bacterium]|nr:hypothetical protein [Polyangiaceae bacterium]
MQEAVLSPHKSILRLKTVYLNRFKETTIGAILAMLLSIPAAIPPSHVALAVAVPAVLSTQTACGPDSLEKLNTTLNQVLHALEAAVDTNGRLYEAGTYGPKGSPQAIELRQKVARVIHDSNEYLIQALNIAKGLTKETFEGSKLLILEKLTLAASGLQIGQPMIDLVLQTVATLINQAVAIAQLFQSSDVKHIRRAIPQIDRHLSALAVLRERNQISEVFAE